MDRIFRHLLCGLVAVLGLNIHAQTINFPDQGQAFAACQADLASAIGLRHTEQTFHGPRERVTRENFSCASVNHFGHPPPSANQDRFRCNVLWVGVQSGSAIKATGCRNASWSSTHTLTTYLFPVANTCATRPNINPGITAANANTACIDGCLYLQGQNFGVDEQGESVFLNWYLRPDGRTCVVGTETPYGRNPDADDDGDGLPNRIDPFPDTPRTPDPPPPTPDPPPPTPDPPPPTPDPPPPTPDPPLPGPGTGDGGDGIDDGQQVVQGLSTHLTAIERAVLGLAPRIDAVRAGIDTARAEAQANANRIAGAIDGVRADANADADRIVGAIDGVRQAIERQGDGEPLDLSPLAPGPDGGEHTPRDAVVEELSASALLAQLDRDGFGMTRACPAHSWTQTFDLGWAQLDFRQASQLICWALGILGWMIALGGLIQASFILGRIGTR